MNVISGRSCIVKSCPNSFYQAEKPLDTIRIFSFPALERRKNKWIDVLNIDKELLSIKGVGVCERHFKSDQMMKSGCNLRLGRDEYPLYFLDNETPSTSQVSSKVGNVSHREPSTPYGGEYLRYLEKYNSSIAGRQYHPKPWLLGANPAGSPILEIGDLENASSSLPSKSPVLDLDKPDEVAEEPLSLSNSPSDFNMDQFNDIDPKEIMQYKIHFPNLEKIAVSKPHCTSCNYHIGTAPINEAVIKMHPVLRVTQCKKCFTFYNSGEFERSEDGSELYCRWCGQGGEVFCCANCPYVFCRRCIGQNLSQNMVRQIQNNDNWHCFACAPECIIPLRANHWALVNFIEKQKRKIINQTFNELEMNQLMSKDISRCCSSIKKRVALKRQVEKPTVITPPPGKKISITPNSPPEKKIAIDPSPPQENKIVGATSLPQDKKIGIAPNPQEKNIVCALNPSQDKKIVIASNPPQEKKIAIAPKPPPRILNASLAKKTAEKNAASGSSVVVQFTPDMLNLFDNDKQTLSPTSNNKTVEAPPLHFNKAPPLHFNQAPPLHFNQALPLHFNQGPSLQFHQVPSLQINQAPVSQINQASSLQYNQTPPLQLIRRELTIPTNQSGTTSATLPLQQSTSPPIPAFLVSLDTEQTTLKPVYHIVNGFRIDLNTAAQQETYRLPNGKLIQVKRQTPNATQSNQMPPEQSPPIISRSIIQPASPPIQPARPPIQPVRPPILPARQPSLRSTRPQLTARNSVGASRPQFQVPHCQQIQMQTQFVDNLNQIHAINGPIIQQLSIPSQQITPPNQAPQMMFTMEHGNSPVEKARTQFEERFINSMEVCQHIIGKINTLTNSSSYKSVKSLMDLKDLTIHLSYLLTYAIGRFKTLQEKCLEDLRDMGFDPNSTTGAASDDDDIEIVEPKTTTINLDSDEDGEVPGLATNIMEIANHSKQIESVNNGDQLIENITPVSNQEKQIFKDLDNNDIANEITEGQEENADDVIVDKVNLLVEPINVKETTVGEAFTEITANNDAYIIKVVEIDEDEEKKSENDAFGSLEQPIVAEEHKKKVIAIENESKKITESIETTKITANQVQAEKGETETSQICENKSNQSEIKNHEHSVENILSKHSLEKLETSNIVKDKVKGDLVECTINDSISKSLADNVDEVMLEVSVEHIDSRIFEIPIKNVDEIRSAIDDVVEYINKIPELGTSETVSSIDPLELDTFKIVPETPEENSINSTLEKLEYNFELHGSTTEENILEQILSEENIANEILEGSADNFTAVISDLSEQNIVNEVPVATKETIDYARLTLDQTKAIIADRGQPIPEEILNLPEKNIEVNISAVSEKRNITDEISDVICDKLADICLPDNSYDSMCESIVDDNKDSSTLLDDIIMKKIS